MSRRVLELFSGLGGWSYALGERHRAVAAYDIDTVANAVYERNHGLRPLPRELATIPLESLAAHQADTWAMSPPCQPFCRLGNRYGLADRRSQAFLHLMELLAVAPPERLLFENVEGFLGSEAHDLLVDRLTRHGFHWRELRLCPSRFGVPNLRPRVYLVAARRPLADELPPKRPAGALAPFLDEEEDPRLYLDPALVARHRPGMDLVDAASERTACFIGGYGERLVRSGSYLVTPSGVRRFSPAEVARLLGYPPSFEFPAEVSLERRYRLLGNGLSLPVARWVAALLDR